MNIAAILDLDKAIETFKNKIQTLLGNVEVSLSVNYVLTRRSRKATGRKKKSGKPGQ